MGFTEFIDRLEGYAIVLVSRAAPWAAPVIPAVFVGLSMMRALRMGYGVDGGAWNAIGVIAAAALEGVGMAGFHITLKMYLYNNRKLKSEGSAPTWLGLICVISYLATALVMTVLVEFWPGLNKAIPAFYVVLTAVAYIILMMMDAQASLLADNHEEAARRRAAARERKMATSGRPVGDATTSGRPVGGQRPPIDPAKEKHLRTLQSRMNGRDFARADVMEICEVGKTWATMIIQYGIGRGAIQDAPGRYRYEMAKED